MFACGNFIWKVFYKIPPSLCDECSSMAISVLRLFFIIFFRTLATTPTEAAMVVTVEDTVATMMASATAVDTAMMVMEVYIQVIFVCE